MEWMDFRSHQPWLCYLYTSSIYFHDDQVIHQSANPKIGKLDFPNHSLTLHSMKEVHCCTAQPKKNKEKLMDTIRKRI